jgi:hypothetical protein
MRSMDTDPRERFSVRAVSLGSCMPCLGIRGRAGARDSVLLYVVFAAMLPYVEVN